MGMVPVEGNNQREWILKCIYKDWLEDNRTMLK